MASLAVRCRRRWRKCLSFGLWRT